MHHRNLLVLGFKALYIQFSAESKVNIADVRTNQRASLVLKPMRGQPRDFQPMRNKN